MVEEKPWYLSRTIWGSLVAVTAALAGLAGIAVDGAMQTQLADALLELVAAAGALVAIWGRLNATNIII